MPRASKHFNRVFHSNNFPSLDLPSRGLPFQKFFSAKRAEEIPEAPELVKVVTSSLPFINLELFGCFHDGRVFSCCVMNRLLEIV